MATKTIFLNGKTGWNFSASLGVKVSSWNLQFWGWEWGAELSGSRVGREWLIFFDVEKNHPRWIFTSQIFFHIWYQGFHFSWDVIMIWGIKDGNSEGSVCIFALLESGSWEEKLTNWLEVMEKAGKEGWVTTQVSHVGTMVKVHVQKSKVDTQKWP